MFGFSVYLNEELTETERTYIKKMSQLGFKGIFTSIHIPEDEPKHHLHRLEQLGKMAKEQKLDLTIDVSGNSLERIGIHYNDLSLLVDMGVTALRVDYGVSHEEIFKISQQMNVVLNASTLTRKDIEALKGLSIDFSRIEAWHNYYPRPETGLDKRYMIQLNVWLQSLGMKVMAFVAGDSMLRGPIHKGLPTLEKHRYHHSLAAALELIGDCSVDKVYIGDPMITPYAQLQWNNFIQENIIYFEAEKLIQDQGQLNHVGGKHTQRQDVARDVVRSQEGRLRKSVEIKTLNQTVRETGSITVDNHLYGRYEGEVQITKVNLLKDEKVNKVGQIQEKDLALLEYIKPNQVFEIKWGEGV
ncbi:MupG family TIM beta-alpha barrel fold protein [Aerococcaceae bacterium WGS1372]